MVSEQSTIGTINGLLLLFKSSLVNESSEDTSHGATNKRTHNVDPDGQDRLLIITLLRDLITDDRLEYGLGNANGRVDGGARSRGSNRERAEQGAGNGHSVERVDGAVLVLHREHN